MISQIHISSLKLSDSEINTHAFAENMHQAGISCAERIIADGKPHHFVSYGTNRDYCYIFDGTTGTYGTSTTGELYAK
ncbi:MAG: hypothetical protein V4482_02065 [Pseudomonadota bacterium]